MADVKELNINNTTYDIKAKSVVDTNSGAVKMWTGTKAEYDAIVTKDPHTLYNVTGVETDADQIITELANKTNVNFNNVTNEAKVLMSGMGMPSKNYGIVLSNPANNSTFVAPANGYFFLIYRVNNQGGWATMRNDTNGLMTGGIGGYYVGNSGRLYLPVLKGDVVHITYDGSAPTYFRFIYAQGSESEAN